MTINPDGVSVRGCSYIYAPAGQAGEYAPLAANPYRGCGHACAYCLSPDTLIQMADGSTRELAHVQIGDTVMGVAHGDEARRAWNWKYAPSKVLNKMTTRKAAIRVTLESGQVVICSGDHRWLTERGWKFTRNLTTNNVVRGLGVRFFNLTVPAIGRKFPLAGKALNGSSRIVAIEHLAEEIEMLDITTSTENFVANGMISHNCYVPRVLKMDRKEFDAGAVSRDGYLANLTKDARKYQAHQLRGQVMLSFTSDVYSPFDTSLTRPSLEILRDHGLGFCVLTKGGSRALVDIDLYRPDRDAFASTLTTLDDAFSQKWERGAQLPANRISTLKTFHERGIFTWVSLEPTLNLDSSLAIVDATHEFVDLYKVGRANYVPTITNTLDWRDYTLRMIEKLNRLGKKHYIKKDLQPFLPPDYPNPLRVEQHH